MTILYWNNLDILEYVTCTGTLDFCDTEEIQRRNKIARSSNQIKTIISLFLQRISRNHSIANIHVLHLNQWRISQSRRKNFTIKYETGKDKGKQKISIDMNIAQNKIIRILWFCNNIGIIASGENGIQIMPRKPFFS